MQGTYEQLIHILNDLFYVKKRNYYTNVIQEQSFQLMTKTWERMVKIIKTKKLICLFKM